MLTTAKGLYVLLVAAHGRITVGKLGRFVFNGDYLYIGSARGPGGFKRVARHMAIAAGRNRTRRWHIDYLLAVGKLEQVWLLPDADLTECELVRRLSTHGARPAIRGFGAGDSPCETHLLWVEDREAAQVMLAELAGELQLELTPLRPDRASPAPARPGASPAS